MTPLKLIALDAEDLTVISAHLQDAVVRVGDMAFLPRAKRFAAVLNRFDWQGAVESVAGGGNAASERRRAGLRFERVVKARVAGIDLKRPREFLSLLAMTFEPVGGEDPGGRIHLDFAGGGAIELTVECVEVELKDLGAAWRTKRMPHHDDNGDDSGGPGRKTNG